MAYKDYEAPELVVPLVPIHLGSTPEPGQFSAVPLPSDHFAPVNAKATFHQPLPAIARSSLPPNSLATEPPLLFEH